MMGGMMKGIYIRLTLEDRVFQDLITEKSEIQIKEMVDQKRYPEEIEELDKKIRERGRWLKENYDNPKKP